MTQDKVDALVAYLFQVGKRISEQARADDANAKNLIALYTMFQKRPEPAAWALLEGAVDDWRKANP